MGTSNSRPKICKVTPKEEQPFCPAASPRMTTAAQHLPQHQQGILGHRQIGHLPPIKQHVPRTVPSPPDSNNLYAKPIHSIIKAHPPQRVKAWQPVACPTVLPAASTASKAEHVSMRNQGGFLPAQTLLIGQATKKRQAHQRHLRKQRRIYTSRVGGAGNVQIESIRLVSRPTQRDIFWDETKGQYLDLREFLQPSPPVTDPDSGMEDMTRPPQSETGLTGNLISFSRHLNENVTKSADRGTEWNFPWLDDFRKHEQNHLNSWDILEGQWGRKQRLDAHGECCEKEHRHMCRNTTDQVNPVHQQWNCWGQTHHNSDTDLDLKMHMNV